MPPHALLVDGYIAAQKVAVAVSTNSQYSAPQTVTAATTTNLYTPPTLSDRDLHILQRVQERTDRGGFGPLWAPLDREFSTPPGTARRRWAQLIHRDDPPHDATVVIGEGELFQEVCSVVGDMLCAIETVFRPRVFVG